MTAAGDGVITAGQVMWGLGRAVAEYPMFGVVVAAAALHNQSFPNGDEFEGWGGRLAQLTVGAGIATLLSPAMVGAGIIGALGAATIIVGATVGAAGGRPRPAKDLFRALNDPR